MIEVAAQTPPNKVQVQQNQAKIDHLKAEAARFRHAVQDANAKFAQVRHEVEHEEREMQFQHAQYYEELKALANQVQEAKRNEVG